MVKISARDSMRLARAITICSVVSLVLVVVAVSLFIDGMPFTATAILLCWLCNINVLVLMAHHHLLVANAGGFDDEKKP